MRSFFGEACLKHAIVARVREHQRLNQIVQGLYWDGTKGCAIGCVLHSADHMAYERQLGLPVFLAYLDEHIFESLPAPDARTWPLRFIEAIPVGVDLDLIYPRFMHWLLTDPHGMRQYADARILSIIERLAMMYAGRMEGIPFDVRTARSAAWSAAWSAARSARSAARSAAWSAAWSADSTARSAARSAAWSAARSAAWSADSTARSAAIHRQAEYLLSLLHAYDSQPAQTSVPCEERIFMPR